MEDYYVFLNLLTLESRFLDAGAIPQTRKRQIVAVRSGKQHVYTAQDKSASCFVDCPYTDPNAADRSGFNGQGHNYFRSENPYRLNSYAGFGEAYYQVRDDLKLTGGLRWTNDQKHFVEIPSEL